MQFYFKTITKNLVSPKPIRKLYALIPMAAIIIALIFIGSCKTATTTTDGDNDQLSQTQITTAPEAPTGLKASDGDFAAFVRLSWNESYGTDGYKIFWAGSADGNYQEFDTTTGTTYDDYLAGDGVTYYYKIKAYNNYGDSPFSNSDSGYAIPVCGGAWAPSTYNTIAVNHSYSDQFIPQSPSDVYYKIYLIKERNYRFTIDMFLYPDDPDLYLYSSYGDELKKSRNGGGVDEVIYYTAPCTGYYYLKVNNWLGDSFTFSIHFYEI